MKRVLRPCYFRYSDENNVLEYLPYEEGIKTFLLFHFAERCGWSTYPMKRVLRPAWRPRWEQRRGLEYLPYEEGIKTDNAPVTTK